MHTMYIYIMIPDKKAHYNVNIRKSSIIEQKSWHKYEK